MGLRQPVPQGSNLNVRWNLAIWHPDCSEQAGSLPLFIIFYFIFFIYFFYFFFFYVETDHEGKEWYSRPQ